MNNETKKPSDTKQSEQNGVEGEGSYTATHNYDRGLQDSVKKGDSEKLGQEAKKALDGPEGDELRKAEKAGKSGQSLQK
ncbi:MAG: hypothetical protein ABI183_25875 [Polyangiaceae bacterium]